MEQALPGGRGVQGARPAQAHREGRRVLGPPSCSCRSGLALRADRGRRGVPGGRGSLSGPGQGDTRSRHAGVSPEGQPRPPATPIASQGGGHLRGGSPGHRQTRTPPCQRRSEGKSQRHVTRGHRPARPARRCALSTVTSGSPRSQREAEREGTRAPHRGKEARLEGSPDTPRPQGARHTEADAPRLEGRAQQGPSPRAVGRPPRGKRLRTDSPACRV